VQRIEIGTGTEEQITLRHVTLKVLGVDSLE